MKLIIGLGNPGSEYFNTRHNFGFLALNYFQDSASSFSAWQANEQFKALLSEGQINGQKILLAKPQTFMNNSGQAVRLFSDFYKLALTDILVLHDDLHLALGQIRLSQGASAGGHKGAASIIKTLGTKNFARLRLGIKPEKKSIFSKFLGKAAQLSWAKVPLSGTEKFVLRQFSETEKTLVQQVTRQAKDAILAWLQDGLTAAQNKFN